MLTNTFIHIPGIGAATEKKIWDRNILSWEAGRNIEVPGFGKGKTETIRAWAEQSVQALLKNRFDFFASHLPAGMLYRIFPEARHHCAYLDIETTGLESSAHITTIALYDGRTIKYFIHGKNLFDFLEEVKRYRVLVTFNGKCFDIPFIEQYFNVRLPHTQIDLRYVLNGLGYKGGLKKIEKAFDIDRDELDGVDGYLAVLLWNEYRHTGSPEALETLLAYNIEDVVNLETLMIRAYNMAIQNTPFETSHQIAEALRPEIPFSPDPGIIKKLSCFYY